MTYQHALRYLCAPAAPAGPVPPVGQRPSLLSPEDRGAPMPVFFCFTRSRRGRAAALMFRSILRTAGIPALHWIVPDPQVEDIPPKERVLLDGGTVPSALLARCVGETHAIEHTLHVREGIHYPPETRVAAALCHLALSTGCRVILLETPEGESLLPACLELWTGGDTAARRPDGILVLSDKEALRRFSDSHLSGIRLVITPTFGAELFRRISDVCARHSIRAATIKQARRERVTPGSQLLHSVEAGDCTLSCGSEVAAFGARLALECTEVLTALRFSLPTALLAEGLRRAMLPLCADPLSIHPTMLADAIYRPEELEDTLQDLMGWADLLPSPRRLYLDPALAAVPMPELSAFCTVSYDTTLAPAQGGTTLLVGSPRYLLTLHPRAK